MPGARTKQLCFTEEDWQPSPTLYVVPAGKVTIVKQLLVQPTFASSAGALAMYYHDPVGGAYDALFVEYPFSAYAIFRFQVYDVLEAGQIVTTFAADHGNVRALLSGSELEAL